MSDPLGLIGSSSQLNRPLARPGDGASPAAGGGNFKQALQEQIARVNELQNDASEAVEDLVLQRRDDMEAVIMAMQKSDTAFKMLLQVRNKMMDAYEEVKQIRV